jgi:hypothetical protein
MRSLVFMASAAVLHFASSGKSRNVVLVATPPVTEPARTTVTNINVHMISSTLLWFHYSTRLGFELVRVFIGDADASVIMGRGPDPRQAQAGCGYSSWPTPAGETGSHSNPGIDDRLRMLEHARIRWLTVDLELCERLGDEVDQAAW